MRQKRKLLSKVRAFEKNIDDSLHAQELFQYDRFECIEMVGGIVEEAWLKRILTWYGGLNILVPLLLSNRAGLKKDPPLELVAETLELAQDYYHLRDYFYYTYNVPRAVKWKFDSRNNVRISIMDDSLPLQLFLELNNLLLGSTEICSQLGHKLAKEVETLVEKAKDEFSFSPEISEAYKKCIEEAKVMCAQRFRDSFLSDDIVFESYSVKEFHKVYIQIVARSLLRRYFLRKYERKGLFHFPNLLTLKRKDFIESLSEATDLSKDTISEVLKDLTLDDFKIKRRQSISSFPLIFNPQKNSYYLFPHIVCSSDCFRSLRKLWALKDPSKYGERIAPVVDAGLVKHISKMFTDSGFNPVIKGITLKDNSTNLPDIDILAFWKEKDFGFVVFACELKSSIPEIFGKDYVSSIGPKGYLTKALEQISRIRSFLDEEQFIKLLKKSFSPQSFQYGRYALNFLIITPHNVGVFAAKDEVRVIDHQTLRYIIQSSKGDILHLLQSLDQKKFKQSCSSCYRVFYRKSRIGKYTIHLPLIGLTRILKFETP